MKLSVCMMVKNEEKHLRECLESLSNLKKYIDTEIIVIDTGSSDRTIEIAKIYSDKLYFHEWNNNFSEMRNITISYATGDWILIIDGDEVLNNCEYIGEFLNSYKEKRFNTATIKVKNLTTSKDVNSTQEVISYRLFRNNGEFKYEGVVHNIPIYLLPKINLESYIIHYGYISNDKELMEKKFKRTSKLLKLELEKDSRNIYYWYQLGVSYSMYGKNDLAIGPTRKAFDLLKNKSKYEKIKFICVYTQLALYYLSLKKLHKCMDVCDYGISISNKYMDLYYYLAVCKTATYQYEEAILNFEKYFSLLNLYKNNDKSIDKTIINYTVMKEDEAYNFIISIYNKLEKFNKALNIGKSINDKNIIKRCSSELLYSAIKYKEYNYIKEIRKSFDDKEEFLLIVENLIKSNSDKFNKKDIIENFSKWDDTYSILNKVRLKILNKDFYLDEKLLNEISLINFSKVSEYWGDIIYFLIKGSINIAEIVNIREFKFISFIDYISKKYDDLKDSIFKYLCSFPSVDMKSYRINKVLCKFIIIQKEIDKSYKEDIIYKYIDESWEYMNTIYNSQIFDLELVEEFKTDEEQAIFFIAKAIQNKENEIEYVVNLRKALDIYPVLINIVNFLKEKITSNLLNNEMEQYKNQLKYTINNLVLGRKYEEAKRLIDEYEAIVEDDFEIKLIKSNISILENKLNINNERFL